MTLIECRDARFSYEGRIVAEELTFAIEEGDYLCVVGENGSGKSTLIKGLVGLKTPTGGSVCFCDALLRDQIGYLPQQTPVQRDFPASVREVVLSGTRALFYTQREKELACEKMRLLEIEDLAQTSYRELSGGQRQRVLLARALCAAKKLLVLDEPAAGLDPLVTEQMYQIIARENAANGMTVVMVSHDVPSAIRYAKHILHLDHTPRFFGEAAQYAQTADAQAFLKGGAQ